MVGALGLVAVLVAAVTGAVWGWQRHLIYFPSRRPVPAAGAAIPGARDVTLHTTDGLDLGAWFVPPEAPPVPLASKSTAAPPGRASDMTVLVANGNGGDRFDRVRLAQRLAARGFAVLLFDYRGYGGNPGRPSEAGLARDVRAAYHHLVEREVVRSDRLIYFGESLGAAVVTELASEFRPAGMVLRSPFVSLAAVGREHYRYLPLRLLLRDRFPVAERIRSLEVPVTVVYGLADSIVPPAQSRAVADAAALLWQRVGVPGADHNDAELVHGDAVIDAVERLAAHLRELSG